MNLNEYLKKQQSTQTQDDNSPESSGSSGTMNLVQYMATNPKPRQKPIETPAAMTYPTRSADPALALAIANPAQPTFSPKTSSSNNLSADFRTLDSKLTNTISQADVNRESAKLQDQIDSLTVKLDAYQSSGMTFGISPADSYVRDGIIKQISNLKTQQDELNYKLTDQNNANKRTALESVSSQPDYVNVNTDSLKAATPADKTQAQARYLIDPNYQRTSQFDAMRGGAYIGVNKVMYMTPEEKNTFLYYATRNQWDKAKEYSDLLERDLDARQAESVRKNTMETIGQNGTTKTAGAVANIASSLAAPLGYVDAIAQTVKNRVTGEYERPNTNGPMWAGVRTVKDTEQAITKDMTGFGKFITDTGLSIGQFAATLPFGGTGALAIMSSSAAGQAAYQSIESGGTTEQALLTGTATGVIEYLTEKLPLEKLLAAANGGKVGLTKALKGVAEQSGLEGSEEVISQYGQALTDQLFMGDKSQYNQLVQQYTGQGMSDEEAQRKAFVQTYVTDPLVSFAAGAISGGVMGGAAHGIAAMSKYPTSQTVPEPEPIQQFPAQDIQKAQTDLFYEAGKNQLPMSTISTPQDTITPEQQAAYDKGLNESVVPTSVSAPKPTELKAAETTVSPPVITDAPQISQNKPIENTPVKADNGGTNKPVHEQIASQISKYIGEQSFTADKLFEIADKAYGGTMAQGSYTVKDAYDAMELAVNTYIKKYSGPMNGNVAAAKTAINVLNDMLSKLPTQTKRTAEMEEYQQFSTPPNIAFLAAWSAGITAKDSVLEPSAGIGGLASFAKSFGATVHVNELSPRRLEVLKSMGFDGTYNFNAEQIDNLLPDAVKPSVVLMNPPFSAAAGRTTKNATANAKRHIEQALARLEPNGRLVAIVGRGMSDGAPAFADWWKTLKQKYNVRANIRIDGKNYTKYGTNFDIQLVIIDKTGATDKTLTGEYTDLTDIPKVLEGIRNDRSAIAVREPAGSLELGGNRVHPNGQSTAGVGGVSKRTVRNAPVDKPTGALQGNNESRATVQPERPGAGVDKSGQSGLGGGKPTGNVTVSGDVPLESGRIGGTRPAPKSTRPTVKAKNDNGVFADYQSPDLAVKGSKKHPAHLVESSAMSAVPMPIATYKPNLPKEVLENGHISTEQLVSITYAGQAHEQMLQNGTRRGFFIGDGTGVGKGTQIAGIILDNFRQGRKKAVWISKTSLFNDATRDWTWVGQPKDTITNLNKWKLGEAVSMNEGVIFASYDITYQSKLTNSRIKQLVDWLGKDFDGVIAFDEAHMMGNVLGKGGMGGDKGSATAKACLELQNALPNARIVYGSATMATDIDGIAFADRLGLWGKGTAFNDVRDFVNKIGASGLSAMELVARDLKSAGSYVARSISYDGVKYERIHHDLDDMQNEIYNTLSQLWQSTLQNIEQALDITGGKKNSRQVANARGQFWSAQQRFYQQIITSMSMPSVLKRIQEQLDEGRSILVQLVNTNDAEQQRQIADAKGNGRDLDELDLTPRETLIRYFENSFPIHAYEEHTDDNGKKGSRLVAGPDGQPVVDKQALALRDGLIAQAKAMSIPDGPLEMLISTFGPENVAEVTGRQSRIVYKTDENGARKAVNERLSSKTSEADIKAFGDGKKRILVFSDAGGTGKSYHASRDIANQEERYHIILQPGWKADNAIQGLGRSNRTNQVSAPTYALVETNLSGQRRFISTIARRLGQLGAITKGQRDTSSGVFAEKDNLETDTAASSLRTFYEMLGKDRLPGIDGMSILKKMGLDKKFTDQYGNFKLDDTLARNVTTFLNRILVLEVNEQNRIFDEFFSIFENAYDTELANGTLDLGTENIKADKIDIIDNRVVRTDENTGAETRYVQAKTFVKPRLITTVAELETLRSDFKGLYRTNDGDVRAVYRIADHTDPRGRVVKQFRIQSPIDNKFGTWNEDTLKNGAELISKKEWGQAWSEELTKAPEYVENTVHMLTGTLLPIWNRLPEEGTIKAKRITASDGSQYLGRVIPQNKIDDTLKRLGVGSSTKEQYTGDGLIKRILEGETVKLTANRITLTRRRVSGEYRIEITGVNMWHMARQYPGLITEKIAYQERYFIPTTGGSILDDIIKTNPVYEVLPANQLTDDADAQYALNLPGWETTDGTTETPVQSVMSLSNLMDKIRHDFDISVTTGNIRIKGAEGVYKPKAGTIRTRISNNIPAVAHELGHHFDKKYDLSKTVKGDVLDELLENMPDIFKDQYKDEKLPGEGVAEFMRRYLSDREQTIDDYPLFYSVFTQRVPNEELTLLDGLADEIYNYMNADLSATSSAAISMPGDRRDFRTFGERAVEKKDAVYQAMVDSNHGIKMFSDFADDNKPYVLATNSMYADNVAKANIMYGLTDIHGNKIGIGLRQALAGVRVLNKQEFRDFNEYLVVRHGPERLREGMRVFADDRKNKPDFMQNRQQQLEHQYPKFKETAERLYDFQKKLLQTWAVDTGLISKETAEKWGKRWDFYVPFNRVAGDGDGIFMTKRGFANQKSPYKKAKGSGLDIISPVESIARNMTKLIQAAIKNNVMREVAKVAAKTDGAGGFLEKVPVPLAVVKYNAAELKRKLKANLMDGLPDDAIDSAFEVVNDTVDDILIQYGRGKAFGDIVTVMINGKAEFWQINDPLMLESLTSMSQTRMNGVLEAYGRTTRFITSNITGNNLIWSIFSNLPRDLTTFFTYSEDKNPVKIVGNMMNAYLQAGKVAMGAHKIDPFYLEYLSMGGGSSNSYLTADRDNATRALNSLLHINGKRYLNPLEIVEFLSNAIEGGPRMAYYKMLRLKGVEPPQAFYESMDITTNFRRSGITVRQLNKGVPFLTASVQGLDKFARWLTAADAPKDKKGKVIAGRFTYFVIASAVLALVETLMAQYRDPEGYKQMSVYVKDNYWLVPLGDYQFFAIPKPRELGALTSVFERLLETFIMDNPHAFDDFDSYLATQFLPPLLSGGGKAILGGIKGDSDEFSAGISEGLGDFGILGTVASMVANKDFRGNPIVSQGLQQLEPRAQFDGRSSKIAVAVGNALNISPKMLDYFFSSTLGGYWKVTKAALPQDGNVKDVAGVSASYIKDSRYSTDVINNFYSLRNDFDQKHRTYPDNAEYKIAANDYDDMATFYSRYAALSKNSPDTLNNLQTRQQVIDMLTQFTEDQQSGKKTSTKAALDKLSASTLSTTFCPQVMETTLVIGEGDKKRTYNLTAAQYVDYQTTYLNYYYSTVGGKLNGSYKTEKDEIKAVNAAKSTALDMAKNYMLKKIS